MSHGLFYRSQPICWSLGTWQHHSFLLTSLTFVRAAVDLLWFAVGGSNSEVWNSEPLWANCDRLISGPFLMGFSALPASAVLLLVVWVSQLPLTCKVCSLRERRLKHIAHSSDGVLVLTVSLCINRHTICLRWYKVASNTFRDLPFSIPAYEVVPLIMLQKINNSWSVIILHLQIFVSVPFNLFSQDLEEV